MNQLIEQFGDRIPHFWESSEDAKKRLLTDILTFANADPVLFKRDLEEVMFDDELSPLPIVLEALSKDTASWGPYYLVILNKIFEQARQTSKPDIILTHLWDFDYILEDHNPVVQDVVDRLVKEIDSDYLPNKLAAIATLPSFLTNPSVRNSSSARNRLQQKLHDKNWKVRYIAFKELSYENMLPDGYSLPVADRIRRLVFGDPSTV